MRGPPPGLDGYLTVDVMNHTNTLTKVDDADDATGAGGFSGSPAITGTLNAHTSASAKSNFLIVGLSPFCEAHQPDSITVQPANPESLFAQFWKLHCANEPHEALNACDRLLEVIDPTDFLTHVRQANARATALRALLRFRESYAVHLSARPLLGAATPKVAADHYHGLGLTLKHLGSYQGALDGLNHARRLYGEAGAITEAIRATVNVARLYVTAERPGLAHQLLNTLEPSVDVMIARAMAYEKEGERVEARKAIASVFLLLADSENEATRKEALAVMARIEGGAS